MKKPLKIGQKEFNYKKDAIEYYRLILNAYNFGASLSDDHYNDLIDLLDYDYFNSLDEFRDDELNVSLSKTKDVEITIADIKVSKVQYNTKCFELFYNDGSSEYISYRMIINNTHYSSEKLFDKACRNIIHADLMQVKQSYFDKYSDKGYVKCQETQTLSKWMDLVVDHRQTNTFSAIVDRFKELNKIVTEEIEFVTNDKNQIVFKDKLLEENFRVYHKEKANLRLVRKEQNLSRATLARIKTNEKDLRII